MRKVCLLAILIFFCVIVRGQLYLGANEYQQRLNNGLQLFYTQLPNTNQYNIILAYKFGALVEDSVTDGLGYVCHTAFLNGLQRELKKVDNTIKVDGRFGFEASTYRFSVSQSKLAATLDAIAKHYQTIPDSNAINMAIIQNATLLGIAQNTLLYPIEQALLHQHWASRAPAMSIYGNPPVPDSATVALVSNLYNTGYCMEAALMVFSGPERFREVWNITQEKLSYIKICPNTGSENLANFFPKPMLSTQMVFNVGNATPTRYQKLYHGPYIGYDPKGAFAAMVLKTILAQSNLALYDSFGIAQLKLGYDAMNQTSGLTFHLFPKKDSIHVAYTNLDSLMVLLADSNIIPEKEIESAKAKLIQQFNNVRKDPIQNAYLISQYWAQNAMPWLTDYPSQLKEITHIEISKLIKDYVLNNKYTALLLLNDGDSLAYDYQKFSTTYPKIDNVSLNFQKNTADFLSAADDSTFNKLRQTLFINPHLFVAINAMAHKSELLNVKDDSLSNALCNYPDFYIYPQNIFGQKSYRLDIYRAAKVANSLLDTGIKAKQLKGTGQLVKGQDTGIYNATITVIY